MHRSLSFALIVLGACAGGGGMQLVSQAKYQTVPAAERAKIDSSRAAELQTAQADESRATAELASARQAAQASRAIRAPAPTQQDRVALARVDRARTTWLSAGVTWRARRLEAAQLHVVALECARELERAEAIDTHTSDDADDAYDTSAFRTQHGHAEEAWYVAQAKAADARKALDQASAALGDAKDAYASLVKDELESAQLAAVADAPPEPHLMW
jgi:hypothetical protein